MNPGMKMLMMDRVRKSEQYPHSEYGGGSGRRMIGYDRDESRPSNYGGAETESRRRRDSRGRFMEGGNDWESYEHDSAHMGGYGYASEPEARRRRDSRGRYMTGGVNNRMEDDDEEAEMRSQMRHRPVGRSMPHTMHGGSRYGFGDVYAYVDAPGAMNRPMQGGAMGGDMSHLVDEQTARMWVQKMDGGEKFKPDQAEQLRTAHCPDCERWEFYTALNAMYSDYCEAAQKMGADRPEFYAYMAKGFLKDKDAKPHKLRRYMEAVAR